MQVTSKNHDAHIFQPKPSKGCLSPALFQLILSIFAVVDIDYDGLTDGKRYQLGTYSISKAANAMFTIQLGKKWSSSHPNVSICCVHPGGVYTDIYNSDVVVSTFLSRLVWPFLPWLLLDRRQGAMTPLLAALSSKPYDGCYLSDLHVYPPNAVAYSTQACTALWDYSVLHVQQHLK